MKCMKCGVSIPSGQVFCETCLTDMAAHPVRPDAPLLLPRRENQEKPKRIKRRAKKPEEMIHSLKKLVALLMTAVVILIAALAVTLYLWLRSDRADLPQTPGQNYSTSTSAE